MKVCTGSNNLLAGKHSTEEEFLNIAKLVKQVGITYIEARRDCVEKRKSFLSSVSKNTLLHSCKIYLWTANCVPSQG
jgi:hypothetical protein